MIEALTVINTIAIIAYFILQIVIFKASIKFINGLVSSIVKDADEEEEG